MSGLVNYDSDSDATSDVDTASAPAPAPASSPAPTAPTSSAPTKKPFQKLIDRSNPGKIVVSLPQSSASADEPPAKRARTEGKGGGLFSSFKSALPPPRKTPIAAATKSSASTSSGAPRPVPFAFFKTSSEAAFSREPVAPRGEYEDDNQGAETPSDGGGGLKLNLPPPKSRQQPAAAAVAGPSAPTDQKPEQEVKLVGKPLMFRPLSVARKPAGRKTSAAKPKAVVSTAASGTTTQNPAATAPSAAETLTEAPKKKPKVSLFSLGNDAAVEEPSVITAAAATSSGYEPLFHDNDYHAADDVCSDYASYQALPEAAAPLSDPHGRQAQSLDTIADDLQLSAAARRELFGRGGSAAAQAATASTVINFNLDQEYRTNEQMRASGELQAPAKVVKGIAPGKHNLRQLVNAVQSQRDALEDSFVKNKSKQADASSRYGWR